jgi:hypothetical protein
MLGVALFGEAFEVLSPSSDEKDIIAGVSNRFLVVLDNLDQRSSFIDDLLARMATGIAISRRKLYTDNVEIRIVPRAHLAVTSMQPMFNREDVADRLLIFRFRRFEGTSFKDEGQLVSEILSKRTAIMTGLVMSLQAALRNLERRKHLFRSTTFRMANIAILLTRICDRPTFMQAILEKMGLEQTKFAGEGHPLTELLCKWLVSDPSRPERWHTTGDLFFELQQFARSNRVSFAYRSARSLGMVLVNQRRQLELRLVVEQDPCKTNNLKRYRFRMRDGMQTAPISTSPWQIGL